MKNLLSVKSENLNKRKIFSLMLNLLVFVFSVLGVFFACLHAQRDGYSSWHKRLLYFTQLSNIWMGATCLIAVIFSYVQVNEKTLKCLFVVKYVFTVSITITGIVFCTLLAPFADFDVWTFSSILTHVVVPMLAIVDFFVCDAQDVISFKQTFLPLIPPAIYFVFASILSFFKVDFGRGDAYPYFFLNLNSEVGLFGFIGGWTPQIGTFYWIAFLMFFIYGLAFLYYKLHNKKVLRKSN